MLRATDLSNKENIQDRANVVTFELDGTVIKKNMLSPCVVRTEKSLYLLSPVGKSPFNAKTIGSKNSSHRTNFISVLHTVFVYACDVLRM